MYEYVYYRMYVLQRCAKPSGSAALRAYTMARREDPGASVPPFVRFCCVRAVSIMIERMFDQYKSRSGTIMQGDYKAYLGGIGLWGEGIYTDDEWDEEWPEECRDLQTTVDEGVDLPAFTRMYTKYCEELYSDYQKVTGVSAACLAQNASIFDSLPA